MVLPRVIRRVSYSCWCGLCGCVGVRSVRAWRRARRQRRSCTAHLSHLKQCRYAHHSCVTLHWTAEAEACVSGADGRILDHCRCILRWNLQPRMIRRWDRRARVAITFRAGVRCRRNRRRRKWVATWCLHTDTPRSPLSPISLARSLALALSYCCPFMSHPLFIGPATRSPHTPVAHICRITWSQVNPLVPEHRGVVHVESYDKKGSEAAGASMGTGVV